VRIVFFPIDKASSPIVEAGVTITSDSRISWYELFFRSGALLSATLSRWQISEFA